MTVEAPEQLPDNSKQQSEAPEALSAKETREIVTPYAFGVADELLGQPLALHGAFKPCQTAIGWAEVPDVGM